MDDYEHELEARVDEKFKPLMRLIWSGFAVGVIWVLLIVGLVSGAIDVATLTTIGFLSLLLPAAMALLFAQKMIRIGMREAEEQRLAELGHLDKRKREAMGSVRLSDDGELVAIDDYEAAYEDARNNYTAR